jgi:hypothetical protein
VDQQDRIMRFFPNARTFSTLLVLALGSLSGRAPAAENGPLPRLYTNQAYVEEAMATPTLAISDPMAVFAFVLGSLPDHVKVYPTENYFYFYFVHHHVRYAGNIRLDVVDRDQGKVHFAYYEDLAEWKDEEPINYVVLDGVRNVSVAKLAPLVYQVSYGGKNVTFELNDLSGVKPPAGTLGPDEIYLGPIFDESAIRFFLLFNSKLKVFHYILDETVEAADQLIRVSITDRILIGKRTGFAFYRDLRINRKILIGVFEGNSRVNNYFDGPFDQLPDNFIEGEALREAILAVEPQLAGKIDRFGISPGGADRYLIAPYRHYRTEDDLLVFHNCTTDKRVPAANYYECFVFEEAATEPPAQPRRRAKKNTRAGHNKAVAKHR